MRLTAPSRRSLFRDGSGAKGDAVHARAAQSVQNPDDAAVDNGAVGGDHGAQLPVALEPIARQLQCRAIVCHHALWDAALVGQVHAAGWRALSYTVNDEWAAERLIALGTDGIVTDRVDLFRPA